MPDYTNKRETVVPQDILHLSRQWSDEFVAVRHDIHQHPELSFEEDRTADLVAANLPGVDDITLAAVDGSEVVFVGHARWADRGDDGKLALPQPPPIRVFRATLPRTGF